MALSYRPVAHETPARILSDALHEARTELRATRDRLRDVEHDLALLQTRYRLLAAERLGSTVRLASGAVLDLEHRAVQRDGRSAHFSDREWELLALLITARGPVDRAVLIETLWGGVCSSSALTRLVERVRGRLDLAGARSDFRNLSAYRNFARYELAVAS